MRSKTALVQEASRGLGLAFVRQLLAGPEFGRVVATCRNPEESSGLRRLLAEHPDRLLVLPLDEG